jgi:predicted nucleotidyltransferase
MNTKIQKFHNSLVNARNQVFDNIQRVFSGKAIEAHVFGSVGRKDSDSYSDLDMWLTFKDADISDVLAKRFDSYSAIGDIVHVCEPPQNSPIDGIHSFVLYKTPAGLLQVDYYLCPQATSFQTKESRKIFGDVCLPQGELGFNKQKVTVDESYRIDFVIFISFIAIKNLARKKEDALSDLFREYINLSEQYSIITDPLPNKENTFATFRQVITNLKKIANNQQTRALLEIETFSQEVESIENY